MHRLELRFKEDLSEFSCMQELKSTIEPWVEFNMCKLINAFSLYTKIMKEKKPELTTDTKRLLNIRKPINQLYNMSFCTTSITRTTQKQR